MSDQPENKLELLLNNRPRNRNVWTIEYISLEVSGASPLVHKKASCPRDVATLELARTIFLNEQKTNSRVEAVRLLDENGVEMFRYDIIQLLAEQQNPARR